MLHIFTMDKKNKQIIASCLPLCTQDKQLMQLITDIYESCADQVRFSSTSYGYGPVPSTCTLRE